MMARYTIEAYRYGAVLLFGSVLLLSTFSITGCAGDGDPHSSVRLNHVQVIGSHNSYHLQPHPDFLNLLLRTGDDFLAWEYSHLPLMEQFSQQGIRQIELDVFADPEGGLYATRKGPPESLGVVTRPAALYDPGFKVLHIQDIDFETTCLTFQACLQEVKSWSDAHPTHVPIMILVETKDTPFLSFTRPIPFGAQEFADLDAEIRAVFPAEQIITPDDVRQGMETLEDAVLTHGWPPLNASRGTVLFALDNGGAARDIYLQDSSILAGRVMFTSSDPGQPDAAFVRVNDPLATPGHIADIVAQGYLVRTRADADTMEARSGDTQRRDTALQSGAHYVSTDYPDENPDFGTGYFVRLPDDATVRCNPVSAPPACASMVLEDL